MAFFFLHLSLSLYLSANVPWRKKGLKRQHAAIVGICANNPNGCYLHAA